MVEDVKPTFDFTALGRPESWLTFAVAAFAELVGAVLLVGFCVDIFSRATRVLSGILWRGRDCLAVGIFRSRGD